MNGVLLYVSESYGSPTGSYSLLLFSSTQSLVLEKIIWLAEGFDIRLDGRILDIGVIFADE